MRIKKLTIFLLGLCIALQLPAQEKSSGVNTDARMAQAIERYVAGDIASARPLFQSEVAANPSSDAAWYYLGLCDLYLRDADKAREELSRAAALDPSNYWYRDRLAIACSLSGEEELTVEIYENILKDFPKKTEVYFNLVNIYLRQNDFDKALAALDQIETVFGRNDQVTTTRYEILMRQGKQEEAVAGLEAFNEQYSSERVLSMLGDYHMSQFEDSLALALYEEALDIDPSYAPALFGKSEIFRMRRDYDNFFGTVRSFVADEDAPAQLKSDYLSMLTQRSDRNFLQTFRPRLDTLVETALEVHPADTSVLTMAGVYYYISGREEEAGRVLSESVSVNPESLQARMTYIELLIRSGQWEKVLEQCDSAYAVSPLIDFLDVKNSAYYNLGDYEALLENCRRMIAAAPGDTSVTKPTYALMGDTYHLMGNQKQAFKAYDKVLKMDPDYVPVLNNYAYYLSLTGKKLGKAYSMSKKTVEKEPDNPTYLDTFGWILFLQGKAVEAKPFFKHAMLYGGKENATILDHYAEVLYALKEYDLARVYWNQAKAKNTEGEIPDLDERVKARLDAVK